MTPTTRRGLPQSPCPVCGRMFSRRWTGTHAHPEACSLACLERRERPPLAPLPETPEQRAKREQASAYRLAQMGRARKQTEEERRERKAEANRRTCERRKAERRARRLAGAP